MRIPRKGLMLLPLVLLSTGLFAQQAPRQLSEQDMQRLRASVVKSKERAIAAAAEAERQQELVRQQEELRRQEEALAYDDDDYYEDDEPTVDTASAVFGAFIGTLNSEMAKKQQQDAERQRFLDGVRRQAEAVDRQRQRELERQRLAEERARLERQAQQQRQLVTSAGGTAATGASATGGTPTAQQQAAKAREEALRANVAVERQRLATERERQQAAQAEAEQKRLAGEKAEAERQRAEEQRRLAAQQALRQAEQNLRGSFRGSAVTCIGGGKAVLYLRSSTPPKTGCNVGFEARCPGTPSGAGIRFSQANYIGGSCAGLGDIIRIGQMSCAAEQVQITMTSANCGG